MLIGRAEEVLGHRSLDRFRGQVQLLFTSPPFPLNRKKSYGNLQGEAYLDWLADFAEAFSGLLTEDGSIVLELGSAWVQGSPTMSTLAVEALLEFKRRGNLHLCQEFIWHNPARLPTPVQWVNVERIRVKDSFTRFWWMSPTPTPKANNRNVLREYSPSMKRLLERQAYNAGKRPSEHDIGKKSFLTNNKGAIPSNVLTVGNTRTGDPYQEYCDRWDLELHPARMPTDLAEFFIRFLTEEGDLVLDPFAGSNTTGATAEDLGRPWLSIEPNEEYVGGSVGRFPGARIPDTSPIVSMAGQ
jgi:site-specific DNA-methyltransferase (cytosine-N4-specific)